MSPCRRPRCGRYEHHVAEETGAFVVGEGSMIGSPNGPRLRRLQIQSRLQDNSGVHRRNRDKSRANPRRCELVRRRRRRERYPTCPVDCGQDIGVGPNARGRAILPARCNCRRAMDCWDDGARSTCGRFARRKSRSLCCGAAKPCRVAGWCASRWCCVSPHPRRSPKPS